MKTPTRDDLRRLLFSDPASDAFEHDARGELDRNLDPDERSTDRVRELIELVGSETGDVELTYEDDAEDFRVLACNAKRGAILLMHAAWAAEQALAALARPKAPKLPVEDPRQLKIGGA